MPRKQKVELSTQGELVNKPKGYTPFLEQLKTKIQEAQVRAGLAVNSELVLLYWNMGRDILLQQQHQGWGAKVIDQLSKDLRREFPHMRGFSPRNLKYIRAFAESYPEVEFVQEVLAQITWYHNLTLIEKVQDPTERHWYAQKVIECGWSRNVMVHQIESRLYNRQGKVVTNFAAALPKPQSELARDILKDPYYFDFLTLGEQAVERDLENALIEHIRAFLLELGVGFAFVGNQYHLEVGGEDFFIDLLFYHLRLRCYVVIELKMTDFRPEYAGKLNFYLSAVDDLLRHPDDKPSVGLLLCKSQNRIVAEYALRDVNKPIGVSEFRLAEALPEQLRGTLPTIEEIEREFSVLTIPYVVLDAQVGWHDSSLDLFSPDELSSEQGNVCHPGYSSFSGLTHQASYSSSETLLPSVVSIVAVLFSRTCIRPR
jgi:predicted nuclease of restriction endonuclease-like (RecB) superfamily